MENEDQGIVPAEGCPHYITTRRVEAWRSRYGNKPTRCKGCLVDGFVPSQRTRTSRRKTYDVERTSIQVDRHLT